MVYREIFWVLSFREREAMIECFLKFMAPLIQWGLSQTTEESNAYPNIPLWTIKKSFCNLMCDSWSVANIKLLFDNKISRINTSKLALRFGVRRHVQRIRKLLHGKLLHGRSFLFQVSTSTNKRAFDGTTVSFQNRVAMWDKSAYD